MQVSSAEPPFLPFCVVSHHPSVVRKREREREGREHLHIQEKGQTGPAVSHNKDRKNNRCSDVGETDPEEVIFDRKRAKKTHQIPQVQLLDVVTKKTTELQVKIHQKCIFCVCMYCMKI